MTWLPLLLADPSPCLRWLVLSELLSRTEEDAELHELTALRHHDRLVKDILSFQNRDGSWGSHGEGSRNGLGRVHTTAQALLSLGYLGFGVELPAIQQGAEYLFAQQLADGAWPLPEARQESESRQGYSIIPFQTGIPLRALAAVGYALDPRSERAYEWLLAQRLPDGAWSSGIKSGKNVFPGGYRRLAHSRFGCRTNTTFAVSALSFHPIRRASPEARRGLDHLLGQESLPAHTLGHQVARTIAIERARGLFTYFARYDVAFTLDLSWRIGASLDDPRVAEMVDFVRRLQNPYGLWEYQPHPEASRWVSFDLLRSLSRIHEEGDWVSLEPRSPFQPYPKRPRRY